MENITLKIEGMSCQHCVMSVKNAVDNIEGVQSSEIEVGSAKVVYDASKTSEEAVISAVKNAGYKIN